MRDQLLSPNSFLQSTLGRMVTLLILVLLWLLAGSNLQAASNLDLPAEFGTVVYQTQADAPTQLFIITNSHRSVITGANGDDTLQAQIETFQIGEWLIRRQQVSLLLPEGFFGRRSATIPVVAPDELIDDATLSRWLADTSSFVNAELLLHEHYGIDLLQVEDRELYLNVRDALLAGQIDDSQMGSRHNGRLESLQKNRSFAILESAALLSRVSEVPRSAILTIGLTHLDDIMEFIDSGEARTSVMRMTGADFSSVPAPVDSYKRPVGITIIIPRSLIESMPLELPDFT